MYDITQLVGMALKIFMRNENLKLVNVPLDGHSLLHAILKNNE